MVQNTFNLNTADNTNIFVYEWLPENKEPEKIIQIIHGMAEHANRYKETAEFFTYNGFAVYAMDLRGHGKTANNIENLGFFAEKNGWNTVLNDIVLLTDKIKYKFPQLPIYLLGHSMGSFFARAYITKYANKINGVIISGTSGQRGLLIKLGKLIALTQGAIKGKHAKSKLLYTMSFKDYNKHFKPTKTEYDWLSRDEQIVNKYASDEYCGWIPSNRFFYDVFDLMDFIVKKQNINKIPKNLPIFILSGENDPVGEFGKGPKRVANDYKKAGLNNLKLKLYPQGRHEMLNEINRQEVLNDILQWINSI